jgi:prevent-host-death family protein
MHMLFFMDIAIKNSYNEFMKVSVAYAKNKLPELIKAAENGERVTICRRGTPVADLVRTARPGQKKPKFGTLRGKVIIHDPDWWKPMTDEEVDDLLEGRS